MRSSAAPCSPPATAAPSQVCAGGERTATQHPISRSGGRPPSPAAIVRRGDASCRFCERLMGQSRPALSNLLGMMRPRSHGQSTGSSRMRSSSRHPLATSGYGVQQRVNRHSLLRLPDDFARSSMTLDKRERGMSAEAGAGIAWQRLAVGGRDDAAFAEGSRELHVNPHAVTRRACRGASTAARRRPSCRHAHE